MVTHNLCIDFGDQPIDMNDANDIPEEEDGIGGGLGYGGIEMDDFVELPEGETEEVLREQGRARREAVLNELFPLTDYV